MSTLLTCDAELFANHLTQRLGDLPMARYRGLSPVGRIVVDIVSPAVANEFAPGLLQLADECLAFHTSNSIVSCRAEVGAGDRSWVTIRS